MSACAAYGCKNRPHNKIPGITFHKFPKDIALRNEWLLALRRVNFRPTKCSLLCSEHFSENQIDRTSLACVRLKANAVPNIFAGYPKHLQKKLKRLSSTENESMITLKRKCIVVEEDEDSMSDEGLGEPEESITTHSEDAEEINRSDIFQKDKSCTSESSNDLNENEISCHPNILRIIPANVSNDAPKLFSSSSLNPDLIDALSSSCQVNNSLEAPDTSDTGTSAVLSPSKLSNEIILQRKVQQLEIMNLSYRKKVKVLQQQNRRQKAKIEALQNRIRDLQTNRTTDDDISGDCISENEIYEELLKHQRENNENSS